MKSKFLLLILLSVFLFDLFFIWYDNTGARFFTKTLLLPLLMVIYLHQTLRDEVFHRSLNSRTFLAGLIFSFFGDLFLLFSWGLLPGLGSFLAAHICYILCFLRLKKFVPSVSATVAVLVYLGATIFLLYPHLFEMKIPVIIYAVANSLMLWLSTGTGQKLLVFGALFFVLSDTILAVNLFVKPDLIFRLLVMITYVTAQFLLVRGIVKANRNLITS